MLKEQTLVQRMLSAIRWFFWVLIMINTPLPMVPTKPMVRAIARARARARSREYAMPATRALGIITLDTSQRRANVIFLQLILTMALNQMKKQGVIILHKPVGANTVVMPVFVAIHLPIQRYIFIPQVLTHSAITTAGNWHLVAVE